MGSVNIRESFEMRSKEVVMYVLERPARVVILSKSKKSLVYAENRLEKFKNVKVVLATINAFYVKNYLKTNLPPDIILLDVSLQNQKSLQIIQEIKEANDKVKILLFTDFYGTAEISNALSLGAYSVCSKEDDDEELISAIKSVSVGACWFDKRVSRKLLNFFPSPELFKERLRREREYNKITRKRDFQLTPKEKEVLKCIVMGMNNPQIAKRLITTVHTAKAHVCSIYQKLSVTDRVQAAVIALQEKLI